MTPAASALLLVAALAAVVDWIAVARDTKRLEYVAKPATTLALIGAAALLDPALPERRWLFVLALVLSLAGDVFLMLRNERFVAGLASFLLAHIAYIAGLSRGAGDMLLPAVVAVVAVIAYAAIVGRPIVRGAGDDLRVPVVLYMVALSIMVILALTRGPWLAAVAAVVFLASDSILAWNKFVTPKPWMRLGVIVTYHLAQAGFVVSLL